MAEIAQPDRRKLKGGPYSLVEGFSRKRPDTVPLKRTVRLNPDGDDKNQWTEVPAGAAWSLLVTTVDAPTVPDTSSRIEIADDTSLARNFMSTTPLDATETVVGLRLKLYVSTPAGRGIACELRSQPQGTIFKNLSDTIAAGTTGWVTYTITAPFSQDMVNSLHVQLVGTAGTGTVTVYKYYIELYIRSDVWRAANARLMSNRDERSGLSLGAGFIGGDCFKSVDLGGGVSAFMMRDSMITSAAGMQQTFGFNPESPGASRAAFPRSGITIANSYDVETATYTFQSGAGGSSYFPDTTFRGTTVIRWPQNALLRSGRLFVVGVLESSGIRPIGRFVAYCDNWSSNPTDTSLWTWTYAAMYGPAQTEVAVGDLGIWDNSGTDGFIYLFDSGVLFPTRFPPSIYRLLAAQFQAATNWKGGEWWNGDSWSKDRPGLANRLRGTIGRHKPRGNTYATTLSATEGFTEGSAFKRVSDGRFQLTGIFDAPWTWDPLTQLGVLPYHMGYALTPASTIGEFAAHIDKWEVPETEDWVYIGAAHPQMTWPGMQANDQVWSYNGNTTSINTFDTSYWPKFVKVRQVD